MFGYNAGGGAYLPRQGSFMIQPEDTFFGLTGPGVVKSVLGEDVTADELGGPGVHGQSGVVDLTVPDEVGALRTAKRLLNYLPSSNRDMAPYQETSDPIDRPTGAIDTLLRKTFNSPTAFNTPFDVTILLQQICDHGDFFELQPQRARNTVTAFGRLNGNVVGFVCNNSAVSTAGKAAHPKTNPIKPASNRCSDVGPNGRCIAETIKNAALTTATWGLR